VDLDVSDLATTAYVDPKGLIVELVPLEPADLLELSDQGPARSHAQLQHLRAHHHIVALRLAAGERPRDICLSLSLEPQSISRLQNDPQFKLLVKSYQEEIVSKAIDQVELMNLVMVEATSALHEKLADPEERAMIGVDNLRKIIETISDRVGHSPVRRSETVSRNYHELSGNHLHRIKELHKEDTAYQAETIEAQVVSTHEAESESAGAAVSIAGAFRTISGPPPADLTTAEGSDV